MESTADKSHHGMVVPLFALAAVAAMLASLWSGIGPHHPAFTWCVVLTAFGAAIFTGPLARRLPERIFYPTAFRARLFALAGVHFFDRFLTVIGWNAQILKMRDPVTGPGSLARLAFHLKASATGHGVGLLIHLATAALALAAGAHTTAFWLGITAIPLHLYPTMLQLVNLRRIAHATRV